MARTRLFGESISPEVIKQLERRAEVLSRGIRNSNDLRYLNEKTSWVRMISGVDTHIPGTDGYSSEDAKNFILSGGELRWDGKKFVRTQGFNVNNSESTRGRYNFTSDLGIRPEAGITAFNVKHVGTYGALREASVNFNVWSRKDLNKVQNLFLRPGMSILLEWGNSIYIQDQDTGYSISDTLNLVDQNNYFIKNYITPIYSLLEDNKVNNSFNYDGFFGLITNFSWSLREDGGYDCSVKVVSRGAILESLTLYKSRNNVLTELNGVVPSDLSNNSTDENKSYLHYALKLIERQAFRSSDQDKIEFDTNVLTPLKNELKINSDKLEELGIVNFKHGKKKVYTFSKQNQDITSYISLNTLCAFFNIAFNFKTPQGNSITSLFVKTPNDDFIDPSYCTFENHFSLNPLYCILPKKAILKKTFNLIEPGKTVVVQIQGVHDTVIQSEKERKNRILSIYISFQEILGDLDKFLEGTKDITKVNLFDFLENILSKLNTILGGINSFDLSFDESLQKWIIVDRNCITPSIRSADQETQEVQLIDVTGIKSTISDIKLQTAITPELSSQIAISAQASTLDNIEVSLPLARWNSNVVDRFAYKKEEEETLTTVGEPESNTPLQLTEQYIKVNFEAASDATAVNNVPFSQDLLNEDVDKNPPKKAPPPAFDSIPGYARNRFIDEVEIAYKKLNPQDNSVEIASSTPGDSFTVDSSEAPEFEIQLFERFKAEAAIRFKKAVYGTSTTNADTVVNSGLIPINLSITLDGISGIKIGQIFKISNNILPDVYSSYGFIITGIDTLVENSKWYTTITGLTFRISNDGVVATNKI